MNFSIQLAHVEFIDSEAPTVICIDAQSVKTDKEKPTAMVIWEDPTASDNSEKVAHVFCQPQSGTNFTIGQTTVMCEAVDWSGNRAECSFQVNVTGTSFTQVSFI